MRDGADLASEYKLWYQRWIFIVDAWAYFSNYLGFQIDTKNGKFCRLQLWSLHYIS